MFNYIWILISPYNYNIATESTLNLKYINYSVFKMFNFHGKCFSFVDVFKLYLSTKGYKIFSLLLIQCDVNHFTTKVNLI